MAYRRELDDSNWLEVDLINSYAVFMGYISMAIKGLGFLVLTWTTVVLLGGFVSMLQLKDFWCLTFITLVQTIGIFDVYQNEKLRHVAKSETALLFGGFFGLLGRCMSRGKSHPILILSFISCGLLVSVSTVVQVVVVAILLCPLAAIYVYGLLISTGISIWRLIQHDYGGNSDGESNLKPAMDTLYYLALLQGVLFCYRFFFSLTKKGLANHVITDSANEEELEVVLTYLRETRIGCEKDPSFAEGRNLITHAVDMIGSKLPDECLSGVKMLYTAVCMVKKELKKTRVEGDSDYCLVVWNKMIVQHMTMKFFITSVTSSPVLQKLLQTLDPRGTFDRETRNQGATIVAHLALDIHLEQYPGAIQYICTLIGSLEEFRLIEPYHRDRLLYKYDKDWDPQATRRPLEIKPIVLIKYLEAYEKLVLTGLCILWKLATRENNCRIMSESQGLLPRIMAPLSSDIIHQFNGGAWSISVVEQSLKVIFLFVCAPGETGAKLRREISSNKEAINTMERILNCDCCSAKNQKRAMGVLVKIYMDTMSRETYIKMLVHIFADDTKNRSIRNLAGEALAKLSIQDGSNTRIILQVNADIVGTLSKILLQDDAENKTCRIRAAEILEQICIHHAQDDESLRELKKDMIDTMPKVLALILRCRLTKDETHGLTEEDQVEFQEKEIDIENQCDNPQDNAGNKDEVKAEVAVAVAVEVEVEVEMDMEVDELDNEEEEEFLAPLLSLFVTVCEIFISADQDLSSQFGTVDAMSLPKKLKEMVEHNNILMVHCVRLMKLTCKMVISMMEHGDRGSYLKEDLESLTEALSSASEKMSLLDVSMVFATEDDDTVTTMKPVRSLASLVKEAKVSVHVYFKAQEPENIEPFISTDG